MGFKLRQPIKIDPVARYEVPFTPDNIQDDSHLVAKANDNGNMIVNKNIPKGSALYKEAKSHEDHHLRAMMDGKLAYDEEAVYHNMDGKGMKRTPRSEFDESDRNLAWEKPAYKAGENLEERDMRPKKDKLNRAGEVEAGKFAFAFREINKPMRKQDSETVSMDEKFGPSMVRKFGGFNLITGECDPVKSKKSKDVSGNATVNTVDGEAKTADVDRPTEQVGGNVNYMIRAGYQPRGEYVNNEKGIRVVKYVNKKGDAQYHQFNNNRDSDNKLHREIDADTFRKKAFTKSQGFVNIKELDEIDSSGEANQSMTDQVTKGKMAGNFETKS